jgi:hypothetical protein
MSKPAPSIDRSGRSILSFQLQSLCGAIRLALQAGQPLGSPSIMMLRRLQGEFLKIVSGSCVNEFPEIDEAAKPADLLVIAEVMNGTLDAFLSPEEGEEKRKFFGFDRVDVGLGPLRVGLGRGPDV